MKKGELIFLVNSGVQTITNHELEPAHAYKVVKFRKAVAKALDALAKDEDAIRSDAGIPDAAVFDKELKELREAEHRTEVQQVRLDEMETMLKRFLDLRSELMGEELTLDCKTLPYEEWHKLQNENKARDIGGRKVDVLSGHVEDLLEGILWAAPED